MRYIVFKKSVKSAALGISFNSLARLSLPQYPTMMSPIMKSRNPKPLVESRARVGRRRKTKQPKFKDKDLRRMTEFDTALGDPVWNASHGSADIEHGDDTRTVSSF